MRIAAAAASVGVLAASAAVGVAPAGAVERPAACGASAVHYETAPNAPAGLEHSAWVGSSNAAFRGYLFYASTRLRTARIPTVRALPANEHPKVLWVADRPAGVWLTIRGRRLDAPGSFAARARSVGDEQFPSYVEVPAAGCWRVTLTSGAVHGAVTFAAVDGP